MLRRPRSWVQWLRRISQAVFLGLFLWVVLITRFIESGASHKALRLFFDFDPLVLLATAISARSIGGLSLLALITVALTLLLGRVFCGWICPLGAVHAIASWFRPIPKKRPPLERRSPWQRAKYILLIALILMAVFGGHWIGVFDPIPLLYRSLTTGVLPATQYAVEDGSKAVYDANPKVGGFPITKLTEPPYRFARDKVFRVARQTFTGNTLILLLFIGIVILNLVRPRFWCRYLCPLGGLLGLLAQRPALRLKNDANACRNCGKCNLACPAAAQPDQQGQWLSTECFGCWNCIGACKFNALSFQFEPPFKTIEGGRLDLSRRATLAAGMGGMAALFSFRVSSQTRRTQPVPDTLMRPPGAREEREFLKRCIQCGACMRACPTNALQPAALEGGLEGLWSPRLVPKIGYCLNNCNLCGQVCPTGAIESLPLEVKQKTKIGLASFDTGRCLPYAYGRDCSVCEEHCPVSPKAIYLVDTEVTLRDGSTRRIRQPRVDPELCIGCGICEWSCVFQDRAAIRVTTANESRNANNQPILPGLSPSGDSSPPSSSSGGAPGPYGF